MSRNRPRAWRRTGLSQASPSPFSPARRSAASSPRSLFSPLLSTRSPAEHSPPRDSSSTDYLPSAAVDRVLAAVLERGVAAQPLAEAIAHLGPVVARRRISMLPASLAYARGTSSADQLELSLLAWSCEIIGVALPEQSRPPPLPTAPEFPLVHVSRFGEVDVDGVAIAKLVRTAEEREAHYRVALAEAITAGAKAASRVAETARAEATAQAVDARSALEATLAARNAEVDALRAQLAAATLSSGGGASTAEVAA